MGSWRFFFFLHMDFWESGLACHAWALIWVMSHNKWVMKCNIWVISQMYIYMCINHAQCDLVTLCMIQMTPEFLCAGYMYNVQSLQQRVLRISSTGWRRLIGCLKFQVIFRKKATIYRALLRKMTYEDKASMTLRHPVAHGLLRIFVAPGIIANIVSLSKALFRIVLREPFSKVSSTFLFYNQIISAFFFENFCAPLQPSFPDCTAWNILKRQLHNHFLTVT